MLKKNTRVSTFGETRSFAKSTAFDSSTARNAQELYSLAKAQKFHQQTKIGMTGFEPATPCSQSICATKLRYIPLNYKS